MIKYLAVVALLFSVTACNHTSRNVADPYPYARGVNRSVPSDIRKDHGDKNKHYKKSDCRSDKKSGHHMKKPHCKKGHAEKPDCHGGKKPQCKKGYCKTSDCHGKKKRCKKGQCKTSGDKNMHGKPSHCEKKHGKKPDCQKSY